MSKPKFLSLDGVQTIVQYFKDRLSEKVDIESGKTLSDNNFSDEEKTKLAGIEADSQVNLIESISVNGNNQSITNKNVDIVVPLVDNTLTQAWQSADAKATGDAISELTQSTANDVANLQQSISSTAQTIRGEIADEVATINQTISDVENAIPTNVSELTNDSNYATTSQLTTQITNVRNDIPTNVSELVNDSDYTTKLYVDGEIASVEGDIPTNISQLNNDSNYTTKSYVDSEIDTVEASIPTKVSQLTNDIKYQTENEVARSIANSVSQITSFDYQILNELPQTGKKGTIYLVLHSHGNDDKFDEYIWVNNRYEKLGNTDIDLSGYARTTDLPTKVSDLNNDSNFTTKTYVDGKLDAKQDVIDYGTPTSADVGKALMPKVISNGEVTEWEFGDTGMSALDTKAPVILNTSSGAIASFTDGADDMPLKKCLVHIEPVQDLHGYDAPWSAGGGENLMPSLTVGTYTYSNVTAKVSNDGVVTITGSNTTGNSLYVYLPLDAPFQAKAGMFVHLRNNNRYGSVSLSGFGTTTTFNVVNRISELLTDGETVNRIWVWISGELTEELSLTFQVSFEATNAVTAWTPYSNICPITGHTGATIVRTGMNLLNASNRINPQGNRCSIGVGSDGSITATVTDSSGVAWGGWWEIPNLRKGVKLRLFATDCQTSYAREIDKNGNILANITQVTTNGGIYTVQNDHVNVQFRFDFISSSPVGTEIKIYPVVMVGSATDTDFVPYQANTYDITFPSEAGTVYGGKIDVVSGELVVDRASLTINGSEGQWGNVSSGTNYHQFVLWLSASIYETSTSSLCDRFGLIALSDRGTKTGLVSYGADRGYRFVLTDDMGIETMEQWKTWLATNNVQLVVKLATPIVYHLTPTEIRTLLGINNVWANTGDIEVTYSADTKEYVDGHGKVTDVQINGTSIVSSGVANVPVANDSTLGVVKTGTGVYGVYLSNGEIRVAKAISSHIKSGNQDYRAITPTNQHESTFYGLAKAAGDDTQSSSNNPVGTYTDEAKSAIQTMLDVPSTGDIPEVPVQDVTVNGTSVLNNGIANIGIGLNRLGLLNIGSSDTSGLYMNDIDGRTVIHKASDAQVKAGTMRYRPIVPDNQHTSVFYGLTKAAGVDMANSSNAVGTYTPEAKSAIQSMLGVPASDIIAPQFDSTLNYSAGDYVISDGKLYKFTASHSTGALDGSDTTEVILSEEFSGNITDIQIDGTSILNNGVANIPLAAVGQLGVVQATAGAGGGIAINPTGGLIISKASSSDIKGGAGNYRPIVTSTQHEATFYGLAKAAGDSTQSSSNNAVGTYTDSAKSAIQTMLDVPSNSDLDDYVKNTDYATSSSAGVVKAYKWNESNNTTGILLNGSNVLCMVPATLSEIKSAFGTSSSLVPYYQHASTFYGLAKAAGDSTQSASNNTVGVYTDDAKSAIQTMLDVPSNDDLDDYVTKESIDNAGITATTYTVFMDDTITTSENADFSYPYTLYNKSVSLDPRYKYRITFNGVEYIVKVCYWYKRQDDSTVNGYSFIGNGALYNNELSKLIYDYFDLPFCLVDNNHELNGNLQILTPEIGTYTIKIERINYTKRKIIDTLIYGDEQSPINKKYYNNSSYVSISIGENLLDQRGTMAIGIGNKVSGEFSQAHGIHNTATGAFAFVENGYNTAGGNYSHAEGVHCNATGAGSHAEGYYTTASGGYSHSENFRTISSGSYSHAEGGINEASGFCAHVEGANNIASGASSHAEGTITIANSMNQHVFGSCNIADNGSEFNNGTYIEIVGNGSDENNRSNARTLDWSGNEWLAGTLKIGGTSYANANEVATQSYVNSAITAIETITASQIDALFT